MADEQTLIYEAGTLTVEELETEIRRELKGADSDPELAGRLAKLSVPPENLIEVRPSGAGFEPGTVMLIVAGIVARDLWQQVILPRIKQRWGADAVGDEIRSNDAAGT